MSIEVNPVDTDYLLPLLWHLSRSYCFEIPELVDILDGYTAEFEILDSKVKLMLDNWSFSIAFEKPAVRDYVLEELRALPTDYF